jgi:hypothetical protein
MRGRDRERVDGPAVFQRATAAATEGGPCRVGIHACAVASLRSDVVRRPPPLDRSVTP